MPKKARVRKTVRVTSGKGGGKVVNTWNWPSCGVIVIYGPGALGLLAGLGAVARMRGWA